MNCEQSLAGMHTIQYASLERGPGKVWMIEIIVRIVRHAEPLHDPLRRNVAGGRERDDVVQLEGSESIIEYGAAAFGCVTPAPMLAR